MWQQGDDEISAVVVVVDGTVVTGGLYGAVAFWNAVDGSPVTEDTQLFHSDWSQTSP